MKANEHHFPVMLFVMLNKVLFFAEQGTFVCGRKPSTILFYGAVWFNMFCMCFYVFHILHDLFFLEF